MASPNHDVHLLARTIHEWLPQGIRFMIEGTYTPRFLKRYYFKEEVLDQLYLADKVLQHLLLQQLKLTFPHVMNLNCYYLYGPTGVQLATQKIREILATQKPKYIIRADIKSYYKSIQHHVLIDDIKRYYTDTKVQSMLENIVRNPIETPRGYKNPDHGIALRGPLSQFFSALYLKPRDDAFDMMDVAYLRYQDDIIILCFTKRQLERCKIRNAREQVRLMVIDGFSTSRIRSYLSAWLRWWVRTSQSWNHQSLLSQFIHSCYDAKIAGIAIELLLANYAKSWVPVDLMAQQDFEKTA
ncbi:reverse transcriptase domain-containing protein [Legionella fallonii]|uniref:reverse transcriptase domain-containing protein n=1 Tax=Legionella fallonii TaxID=96230 RepID=UPI000A024D69|nr:reverse transcriptase domain-containing protein [Legionella fallonii]